MYKRTVHNSTSPTPRDETTVDPSAKATISQWVSQAWGALNSSMSNNPATVTNVKSDVRPCPCQQSLDSDSDSDSEYGEVVSTTSSHYTSLKEFLESVQHGNCERCRVFAQAITSTKHLEALKKKSCLVVAMGLSSARPAGNYHVSIGGLPGLGHFMYELAIATEATEATDLTTPYVCSAGDFHHGRIRLLPTSTGSAISMDWAIGYLRDCMANHDRCNHRASSHKMPRRLLDLEAEADIVKLSRVVDEVPYACLSHCWGGKSPMKTLKSNVEAHEAGLEIHSLGRTFQDAVAVVRKLGIRYLWIDTFCIVQDDDAERGEEIASMCEIYRNCTISIAATAGKDSSSGCFNTVDDEYVGFPVENLESSHESAPLYFRRCSDHSDFLLGKPDGVPNPLLTRGWVFQERILAPRILHFSGSELVFECLEATACQCGYLETRDGFEPYKASNSGPTHDREDDLSTPPNDFYVLVQEYTELDLTMSSDRIPALSGLAKDWSTMNQGAYLAGMWEESIALGLSWSPRFNLRPQLDTWQAPTWSWASVNGAIGFRGGGEVMMDPVMELVSFDYHTDSVDPFGKPVYGSLVVSAPCAHVRFRATKRRRLRYTFEEDERNEEDLEETEIVTNLYDKDGLWIQPANMHGIRMDHELTDDQISAFEQHAEVLMLQLGIKLNIPDPYPYEVNGRYVALLLRPVPGEQGTFERFALYEGSIDYDKDIGWEPQTVTLV